MQATLPELAKINLPDKIKRRAIHIFREELHSPRFKKQKRILTIWYCLYCAYEETGQFIEPGELAAELQSLFQNGEHDEDSTSEELETSGGHEIPKGHRIPDLRTLLTHNQMKKAFSIHCEANSGYAPPIRDYGALDVLESFCRRLGLSIRKTKRVLAFGQNLFEKVPDLAEPSPYKIAAGIILSWAVRAEVTISLEDLCALSSLSPSTIEDTRRTLDQIE